MEPLPEHGSLSDEDWELAAHRAQHPRLYAADWYDTENAELQQWAAAMQAERDKFRAEMGLPPIINEN